VAFIATDFYDRLYQNNKLYKFSLKIMETINIRSLGNAHEEYATLSPLQCVREVTVYL
jgi:hypothetical protein